MAWLAFDIGCIECGEPSAVIGVYATREAAEAACAVASEEQERNWVGQHSMEVFDLSRWGVEPSRQSISATEVTGKNTGNFGADGAAPRDLNAPDATRVLL